MQMIYARIWTRPSAGKNVRYTFHKAPQAALWHKWFKSEIIKFSISIGVIINSVVIKAEGEV